MPPVATRVQFQFQDVTDTLALGWTENFYSTITPSAAFSTALVGSGLIASRLALLGNDYRLSQIRMVGVGFRADTAQISFTLANGQGTFPPPTPATRTSEQPWDAVLVRFNPRVGGVRNFSMRGIPTGVFLDTFQIGNTPVWLQNFQQWANNMNAGALSLAIKQLNVPPPATLFPLLPPTVVNQRALSFTLPNPAPVWLIRGAVIRIRGITGADHCNHLWRVQDLQVGANTTIITTFPGRRIIYGVPGGVFAVDQVTYTYNPLVGQIVPIRGMKRATGRPPGLLRGRARVQQI